jgi:acyl-CoA thioesterase I
MSRVIAILLSLCVSCGPQLWHGAIAAQPTTPVILVFGDSLSAAYGIDPALGWVNLLRARLQSQGYKYQVVNASVSGETTAGGLARLARALETQHPRIVVLELGANDGLRALPLAEIRGNLDRMLTLSRQAGRQVLLLGIHMPPNYGPRFTAEFDRVYVDLASQHKVALVPFLLEHVADRPELMQGDGMHPTAAGQPLVLDNVWPALSKLLQTGAAKR